jgi:hypothetical protein
MTWRIFKSSIFPIKVYSVTNTARSTLTPAFMYCSAHFIIKIIHIFLKLIILHAAHNLHTEPDIIFFCISLNI